MSEYILNMSFRDIRTAKFNPKNIDISKTFKPSKYNHEVQINNIKFFDVNHAIDIIKINNLFCDIVGYISLKKRLYTHQHKRLMKLIFYFKTEQDAVIFKLAN